MDDGDGIREWQEYLKEQRDCPDFARSSRNELNELEALKARVARLEEQLADYKSLKRLIAKAWLAQAGHERFLSWLMPRYGHLSESVQCRELSGQIEQQAQSLLDSLDTQEEREPT